MASVPFWVTGGRQALMEAQRYPQDYNGVVAGAPAIHWPKLMMQSIWGSTQMNLANDPVPACKLAAATAAAIAACDGIDYYTRVEQQMGGAAKTSEFARLFLAPGIGHCGGGAGPAPYGQLDALVSWVEDGKAPVTLPAARRDQSGAIRRSRPLCPFPLVAKYKGSGSTDDAANFVCSGGF